MVENVYIHKIIIIQSLREDDLKTGSRLEEDVDTFISAFNINITVEIKNIENKQELIGLLNEIKSDIKRKREIPLLHIEAHGNKDGLELTNGEFLSWQELKLYLIAINIETRFNLFIVLAMCNGAYFLDALKIDDRSPCVGMLAPIKPVYPTPLLSTFINFYKKLFKTADIFKSAIHINQENNPEESVYFCTSAYHHCEEVMKKLKENTLSKKAIREDAKTLYRQAKKDKLSPLPSIGAITRMMQKKSPEFMKEMEDHYLMFDLFPENRNR